MKTLNIQIENEIHGCFREYSTSQERSMKGQLAWMVKEAVKQYKCEKEIEEQGKKDADELYRRIVEKKENES